MSQRPTHSTSLPPSRSQLRPSKMSALLQKSRAFLTPRSSSPAMPATNYIFPTVSKEVDGEDCDHDCETCEVRLPKGWKIDEDEVLYGHVNGWSTHLLVATGKTDVCVLPRKKSWRAHIADTLQWVKDVSDEKGSVMQAVRDCKIEPANGVGDTHILSGINLLTRYTETHALSLQPARRA